MAIKQLSVFVENKPHKLADIVKTIADAKINIRAISIADTKDFGIVRLITSDVEKAKAAIEEESVVLLNDVVVAKMSDHAGALYNILSAFGDENINIEYMYAFTSSIKDSAYVVLRVNDNDIAERVLNSNGIDTLSADDINLI